MKNSKFFLPLLLILCLLTGCAGQQALSPETTAVPSVPPAVTTESTAAVTAEPSVPLTTETPATEAPTTESPATEAPVSEAPAEHFDYSTVPPYSGNPFTEVHDNIPFFTRDQITDQSYEQYAPLDALGRCGPAVASIGPDLMPTEERGSIGMVKPSGWHTVKYDFVDGKYLYNRCHLIGFQLTGENANTRNLITGTRYLNIQGMLPFENMVADYIKETGSHVLYRVTPVFLDQDLLCRGVLMEGLSVEDGGEGICFCVFAYNVQPGAELNYADGSSTAAESPAESPAETQGAAAEKQSDYVANRNTKKFHLPSCSSVEQMKESNRVYLHGTREEIISQGYEPCKRCNP